MCHWQGFVYQNAENGFLTRDANTSTVPQLLVILFYIQDEHQAILSNKGLRYHTTLYKLNVTRFVSL